jgi:hypothetical protein
MNARKLSQIEEPGESFIERFNGAIGLNEDGFKPLVDIAITRVPSVCDLG